MQAEVPLEASNTPPVHKTAIRTLWRYLWREGGREMRVRLVLAAACLLVAKVAGVYVPILFKRAVDALSPSETHVPIAVPVAIILSYGIARIGSLAFGELRDLIAAKVTQRAIRKAALAVFRHLHALSLRFHIERQTGGLTRSIERGTRGIQTLMNFMLFNILPTLIEIAMVTVVVGTMFNAWFATVTFGTVAIYIGYTVWITTWRIQFRRQMNEEDNRANTKAIDSLINFETVKYFTNEEHEAHRYDDALKKYEVAAVKSQSSLAVLNLGQVTIISIGVTAIMYMASVGIAHQTMTLGDFVLVNTYLLQLYQPLGFFGFVYREVKQSLVDMEDMFSLFTVNREIPDHPGAAPLQVNGGEVVFENVWFGYHPERWILKGVSFHVPAGHTVAIVGASGAGKSTLSRLLFRFYDVQKGAIRIDGEDIREVQQRSLRAAIGIVPQDTVLFNDTIRYNIGYGLANATSEDIEKAARLAHMHDFVMNLPGRYESIVGERGLKLSGGEKQRVAIARTILKNPKILVFDEATSALDTHTEKEIQGNLREVSRGRTAMIIAHRLSTIVDANEILVLENGHIVERGTHESLLHKNAVYARLWRRQLENATASAGIEA